MGKKKEKQIPHPLTDYERGTLEALVQFEKHEKARGLGYLFTIDGGELEALKIIHDLRREELLRRIKDGMRVSANERLTRRVK